MSDGPSTNTKPDWVQLPDDVSVAVLRSELEARIRPLVEKMIGKPWAQIVGREVYVDRAWSCVDDHGRRLSVGKCCSWIEILDRLERGDLGYERPQSNILQDICLAQALVLQENEAARRFERELMPLVRRVAQRVAGMRGIEMVENFLADLILPREERPSRLASYRGRTSLQGWVAAVVSNHCLGKSRSRRDATIEETYDPVAPGTGESLADLRGCAELLEPVLRGAVQAIPEEDRLLLKFLILDEVPQNAVARTLRIHSGNVTRRRQRAAERIWQQVQSASRDTSQSRPVQSCLELVLAGEDRELKVALGGVLAAALPGGPPAVMDGNP